MRESVKMIKNKEAQILEQALHLPSSVRAFLAEKLLESLDSDIDFSVSDEWRQEIARRCEQIDQGDVELIPAEIVFEKAFEALK